ncbi:exodeoxyribonuclease VII large subunit [Telmatocola sphagniphila]|uniref:Exodeoxyribonuclease 7 large subunit n=1 Tax=Telmatocola sphagniphila TaxID=1123043 RepID=A0A8E6B7I3_9BACT|nr:exodeoxyribonuclease VII large subunit [Telmatocola sphagniphila]QVL33313.1 exodeoxyribonuclease VII large subunit [Telmatocola sphagniphila]
MTESQVLTISAITATIKQLLEAGFPQVWVAGEISNLSRPASKHLYFALRDSQAQLKCVMYRSSAERCPFDLHDGLEILAKGRITVYPPSGQYQLIVDAIQPKGMGLQELKLRQLKEKLQKLGYFSSERKRPLPKFPRRIALVTSPTGAAIRDMLEVFRSRWPVAEILLFPVRVQGDTAPAEIARAIRISNETPLAGYPIDLLIVGRGGGSAEDLSAFDTEIVADAIFESRIPVISAVGHEIDVSISDMVADYRALTPTQAAVACTPVRDELLSNLEANLSRLGELLRQKAERIRVRLDSIVRHQAFRSPLDGIRDREQRLDLLADRLLRNWQDRKSRYQNQLVTASAKLESLSPLKVLSRGYSLTQEIETSKIATTKELKIDQRIRTRLADGEIISRIEEVKPAS